MKKVIVDFTPEAKEKLINWILEKGKDADTWDMDATVREALDRASNRVPGKHEPSWEIRGFYTKSGNPQLYDFVDSDFVYEEIES